MKIRPLYRFFIWLFLIFLVVVSFLAYYFQYHEKDLFLAALRSSISENISASDVDYDFPFGFSLEDFQIEGVIQAKRLSVQVDLNSFREKKLVLNQITLHKPIITWRRVSPPEDPPRKQKARGSASPDEAPPVPPPARLVIKKLQCQNGLIHYVDQKNSQILSFQMDNVHLKIDQLTFPLQSVTTSFQLTGRLIKENTLLSGSRVKASGWINLIQKDLDGYLLILEKDGDAGLSAHAFAENNNMVVEGKIKAKNALYNDDKPLESVVDNIILGTLSNIGVEIGANFSFHTKVDDFTIEQISFSGSVSSSDLDPTNPVAP